jgi:hypothetical protein
MLRYRESYPELAKESIKWRLRHVFISYSGHGVSVPDQNGDEVDARTNVVRRTIKQRGYCRRRSEDSFQ